MNTNQSLSEFDYYEERTKNIKKNDFFMEIRHIDNKIADSTMIKWHWHEEFELICIAEGQAYVTCESDSFTANAGDIVFINQGKKHFLSPCSKEGFVSDCIIFHPCFLLGFGNLKLEQKYIAPVIQNFSLKALHISKDEHPLYQYFIPHINSVIALNAEKASGYELLSKSELLIIWKYLFDYVSTQNQQSILKLSIQDEHRVKQAILFIQEHYMEQITLDDISNSIMVSKSECCRCFKRTLNVTPFEYLMQYRIAESTKRMYKKPTESIAEVACSVGFNNTSYFNKIFKKIMHCTPTSYRNNMKKDL